MKQVFPQAQIVPQRVDEYPITVTIFSSAFNNNENDPPLVLWTGSQRDLFRKYAPARRRSQSQIADNCRLLVK